MVCAVCWQRLASARQLRGHGAASGKVEELEVIVVTGSYIQGAAEDAALPVDVFTADDLQMQGSPTMVDLVKSIPAVQGVLGESNQFGSAQSTGTSNINLRGIGAVRTLVLMNGRRICRLADRQRCRYQPAADGRDGSYRSPRRTVRPRRTVPMPLPASSTSSPKSNVDGLVARCFL